MTFSLFNHIEAGYSLEAKGTSPRLIQQVHSGMIVPRSDTIVEADGVFTSHIDELIYVFTADCIPLLFFSTERSAPVAAVHCGWRGAMNRIADAGMMLFKDTPVHVVVGPSILQCCFEVKSDLVQAFSERGHSIESYLRRKNGRLFFDLVAFVIGTQLRGATVHLEWSRCTVCSLPTLPSYRRNKSTDPQIRTWIVKKNRAG